MCLIIAACSVLLTLVSPQKARSAGPPRYVDRALHAASARFGVSYWQMRTVSFCESRWNPHAVGAGSLGLFQFLPSTWAHTPFAAWSIFNAKANAYAAAWLVRRDHGWSEWTCKP